MQTVLSTRTIMHFCSTFAALSLQEVRLGNTHRVGPCTVHCCSPGVVYFRK